jgi:hypothetical protein
MKESSFERVWQSIKEPLISAVLVAGAAEYHAFLPKNEHQAAVAWGRVNAESLMETELLNYLLGRIRHERKELHEGMSIDSPPKEFPRIRAVRSAFLDSVERDVINQAFRRGERLSAEQLLCELKRREGERAKGQVDTTFGGMDFNLAQSHWMKEVQKLEGAIESERTRRYADFVDGRPINAKKIREERIKALTYRLKKAKGALTAIIDQRSHANIA